MVNELVLSASPGASSAPCRLSLARAFLAHYDAVNRGDLGDAAAWGQAALPFDGAMPEMPFVGDDPDGTYWPAGSAEARSIPPEDRVPLPRRAVAEAWGKEGVGRAACPQAAGRRVEGNAPYLERWAFTVDGVGFLCRAPAASAPLDRVRRIDGLGLCVERVRLACALRLRGEGWAGAAQLCAFVVDPPEFCPLPPHARRIP